MDDLVGLRIAINPVTRDGRLLGEIAAEVFPIPFHWSHVLKVKTRIFGRQRNGWKSLIPGPTFNMVPPAAASTSGSDSTTSSSGT
jgi:hypothetical protein